jgi:phosphoribosylaminoimidazole-succinocarboxamide synthase
MKIQKRKPLFVPFPGQTKETYVGKVRDVHEIGNVVVAVTTNSISAFDVILPFEVQHKGAVLNMVARYFMEKTKDIIPNCLLSTPSSQVALWKKVRPFKVEVIVRAYNVGSFYRNYGQGQTNPWGYDVTGIGENEKFNQLLITPTSKADEGHDEDVSIEHLITANILTQEQWDIVSVAAIRIFERGQQMAQDKGLILVDTKFEFGVDDNGVVMLIDEVLTPDSSRYWYVSDYDVAIKEKRNPKSLSKEFVREYLLSKGFKGDMGQALPEFDDDFIESISKRYIELFEVVTGLNFQAELSKFNQNVNLSLVINNERCKIEGPAISIVMGSKSDLSTMRKAIDILLDAGVLFELGIVSAHRTPEDLEGFAKKARTRGIKVIIAGAGGAAHLPGMVAASTSLPVIGVPVKSSNSIQGVDSLYSIVQMPPGVPVGAMAIDGALNAGIYALQIIGSNDERVAQFLDNYKSDLIQKVQEMNEEISNEFVFLGL